MWLTNGYFYVGYLIGRLVKIQHNFELDIYELYRFNRPTHVSVHFFYYLNAGDYNSKFFSLLLWTFFLRLIFGFLVTPFTVF